MGFQKRAQALQAQIDTYQTYYDEVVLCRRNAIFSYLRNKITESKDGEKRFRGVSTVYELLLEETTPMAEGSAGPAKALFTETKALMKEAKDLFEGLEDEYMSLDGDLDRFEAEVKKIQTELDQVKQSRSEKWRQSYRPLWVGDKVECAERGKGTVTAVGLTGGLYHYDVKFEKETEERPPRITEDAFLTGRAKVLEAGTAHGPQDLRLPTRTEWQKIRDEGKVPKGYTRASIGDLLDAVHAQRGKDKANIASAATKLKDALVEYKTKLEKEKKGTPSFVHFLGSVLAYLEQATG